MPCSITDNIFMSSRRWSM